MVARMLLRVSTLQHRVHKYIVISALGLFVLHSGPVGAGVDVIDDYWEGPLLPEYRPPYEQWRPVVYEYVYGGKDIFWVDKSGATLLHYAILYKDESLSRFLVEKGILDYVREQSLLDGVFMMAAFSGLAETAGLILDYEKEKDIVDLERWMSGLSAAVDGQHESAALLLSREVVGLDPQVLIRFDLLLDSARAGNVKIFQGLLDVLLAALPAADFREVRDDDGLGLMMYAVAGGSVDLLEVVLGMGLDMNERDSYGRNAIVYAIDSYARDKFADMGMMDVLYQRGVDLCGEDVEFQNPETTEVVSMANYVESLHNEKIREFYLEKCG